jgi:hypothetical protein
LFPTLAVGTGLRVDDERNAVWLLLCIKPLMKVARGWLVAMPLRKEQKSVVGKGVFRWKPEIQI